VKSSLATHIVQTVGPLDSETVFASKQFGRVRLRSADTEKIVLWQRSGAAKAPITVRKPDSHREIVLKFVTTFFASEED